MTVLLALFILTITLWTGLAVTAMWLYGHRVDQHTARALDHMNRETDRIRRERGTL